MADPAILKKGVPTQDKRGGSNYMSPFKCIDRPKKGVPTPGTLPMDPPLDNAMTKKENDNSTQNTWLKIWMIFSIMKNIVTGLIVPVLSGISSGIKCTWFIKTKTIKKKLIYEHLLKNHCVILGMWMICFP